MNIKMCYILIDKKIKGNKKIKDVVKIAKVVFLFGIETVIILSLMVMVFRNLDLIIQKSEDSTPFQADNVRFEFRQKINNRQK